MVFLRQSLISSKKDSLYLSVTWSGLCTDWSERYMKKGSEEEVWCCSSMVETCRDIISYQGK